MRGTWSTTCGDDQGATLAELVVGLGVDDQHDVRWSKIHTNGQQMKICKNSCFRSMQVMH